MLDQGVTKGFDMFSLKYEENSNTSTMKQKWILKKKMHLISHIFRILSSN